MRQDLKNVFRQVVWSLFLPLIVLSTYRSVQFHSLAPPLLTCLQYLWPHHVTILVEHLLRAGSCVRMAQSGTKHSPDLGGLVVQLGTTILQQRMANNKMQAKKRHRERDLSPIKNQREWSVLNKPWTTTARRDFTDYLIPTPSFYKLCHVKAGVNRLIFSLFLVDDLVYVSQKVFGCS